MGQIDQFRKGSTQLLILSTLQTEKMYGYQIMREIERRSEGYFSMTAALLYPALHEMEQEGLLDSVWEEGQGRRRRKYYAITETGRKALEKEHGDWKQFFANLFHTLQNPPTRFQEDAK